MLYRKGKGKHELSKQVNREIQSKNSCLKKKTATKKRPLPPKKTTTKKQQTKTGLVRETVNQPDFYFGLTHIQSVEVDMGIEKGLRSDE